MTTIRVNLGPRSYDIAIVSGDAAGIGPFARQRAAQSKLALVVADSNIEGLAEGVAAILNSAGFVAEVAVVPAGEVSKSLEHTAFLYDRLAGLNADRKTLIVAVGGGVVGD